VRRAATGATVATTVATKTQTTDVMTTKAIQSRLL